MNNYLQICYIFLAFFAWTSAAQGQSTPCSGVITTYPVTQSFENTSSLWTQWNSAPLNWDLNVGPTPTPNTGPSSASNGLAYMYVEATGQSGSAVLESPCFDLTSLSYPQITFDYHMHGPDAFRLVIQASTDGGTSWGGLIFSVLGDQGPNWNSATIELDSYVSASNFRFRVIGVVGVTSGDLGDVAIDNFVIGEGPACFDISVNYDGPSCPGDSDGTADLLVYPANTSGLDISWSNGETTPSISNLSPGNYSVVVTDNVSCTKTKSFTIFDPLPIDANIYITPSSGSGVSDGSITAVVYGGSTPYTYSWLNGNNSSTNGGLIAGFEELTVTDGNGCIQKFPTFVGEASNCSGSYNSWPYHLSFDGNLGRFTQSNDDDRNWSRRSGGTPTSNTGPSGPAQGSKYRYVESSGSGGPFKTGALVSKKCFDITSLSNPELYFKYHMYGSQMGHLFVQVSTNGGATWRKNLWEISGDQGNSWNEAYINLNGSVSSELVIRIVARTGSGSLSDIAIDDLHIRSAGSSSVQQVFNSDVIHQSVDTRGVIIGEMNSKVFPNPVNDVINITNVDEANMIQILDLRGVIMNTIIPANGRTSIDCHNLASGLYLLKVINNNGNIETHRIIKL